MNINPVARFSMFRRPAPLSEEETVSGLVDKVGVPIAYAAANWEDGDNRMDNADRFREWLVKSYTVDEYPKGVLILGEGGSGKSSLLGLIARFIFRNYNLSMSYYTPESLLATIMDRDNIGNTTQVLLIDGYGRRGISNLLETKMCDVIEYRFSHRLTTYITIDLQNGYRSENNNAPAAWRKLEDKSWMYPKYLRPTKKGVENHAR